MKTYETYIHLRYLMNSLHVLPSSSKAVESLWDWIVEHNYDTGLDAPAEDKRVRKLDKKSKLRWKWRTLKEAVRTRIERFERNKPGVLDRKLRKITKAAGLSELDTDLLAIFVRYHLNPATESLVDAISELLGGRRRLTNNSRVYAAMLGVPTGDIASLLSPHSRLMASGLLRVDTDGDITPLERLVAALRLNSNSTSKVYETLIGTPAKAELEWQDYEHIAEERDHVERIIRGALKRQERGVNILLYGPPGTGKTEFCKTLSAKVSAPLYVVGEEDNEGQEPTRFERLAALKLFQRFVPCVGKALLLFDEMEELLGERSHGDSVFYGRPMGSKVYLNRLLETTAVPILWTINDLCALDPAVLRRMTYAIELKVPTAKVRERVWARELSKFGLSAPISDIRELANEFEAAPALAATAVRCAKLTQGGLGDMRRAVRSLTKALRGGIPAKNHAKAAIPFDPSLVNTDLDLVHLAERISGSGTLPSFSLCLYGPPGTGKSAYVRYLADRLGMTVLHKRASDLLSKWHGESEQKIAAAFEEARERQALLVFDEADSLLSSRQDATNSWEISQVNEMLTWMEEHTLPFACTTNLMDRLDEASLRRFTFKVRFDYLSDTQAASAYHRFFGRSAPDGLLGLNLLTPGDFTVAKRKASIMGAEDNDHELFALLSAECQAKMARRVPIGFRR